MASVAGQCCDHVAAHLVHVARAGRRVRDALACPEPCRGRFGGMISFNLCGGTAAVREFLYALELCTIAVSLGDCATLVWPISGTNQIRLSVGLEDPADLGADVTRALSRIPILKAQTFQIT